MIKYGLIGYPLEHSFSKKYFEENFYSKTGMVAGYDLLEISDIEQIKALKYRHGSYLGFNVTIPYKQSVLPLIDWLSPEAQETGSINTIKIEKERWLGFNTDWYGFECIVKPYLNEYTGMALILGNGGASKAVQYVFNKYGIPFKLVTRKHDKHLSYEDLNADVFKTVSFLVNTTPLGMYPNIENYPPVPYSLIRSDMVVIDLIYNPLETVFLKKAGNFTPFLVNGLEMLYEQANLSWKIWTEQT